MVGGDGAVGHLLLVAHRRRLAGVGSRPSASVDQLDAAAHDLAARVLALDQRAT